MLIPWGVALVGSEDRADPLKSINQRLACFLTMEMQLTVDNYTLFKPCVGRVTDDEKDINEADQTDPTMPLFAVNRNFPGMNVAATPRSFMVQINFHG